MVYYIASLDLPIYFDDLDSCTEHIDTPLDIVKLRVIIRIN